jgi:cytidyltransferase-like protein
MKVFTSGCFDVMHSGHINFLTKASKYGELYVAVGSDRTIESLKGRKPINNERERLYMVNSLNCVKEAFISSGDGILDFQKEIRTIEPHIFIVNNDGNYKEKRDLCEQLGIEYLVLERDVIMTTEPKSSTHIISKSNIPFRIDMSGGWLDQPFVSKYYPGCVTTISIEPIIEFNNRSGMASSTRKTAIELWQNDIPCWNSFERLAKILFCCDNPPGKKEISGSQDAIGITIPGINRANYDGEYWPESIESINDDKTINWLEDIIKIIPLCPRSYDYNVLSNTDITEEHAQKLSYASNKCWKAMKNRKLDLLGKWMINSFKSQIKMFPSMINDDIQTIIDKYSDLMCGYKISGAGGGGYIIAVSDKPIPDSISIKIRRKQHYEIL